MGCPPGYYCSSSTGTIEPLICPTYKYCPARTSTPLNCPAGTYTESFMKGLEIATQCAPCPTGYFCPDGTFS
jgi:hypothetical protein